MHNTLHCPWHIASHSPRPAHNIRYIMPVSNSNAPSERISLTVYIKLLGSHAYLRRNTLAPPHLPNITHLWQLHPPFHYQLYACSNLRHHEPDPMAEHPRGSHELGCGSNCVTACGILLSYRWTQRARIRGEQDARRTGCGTDDCLRA